MGGAVSENDVGRPTGYSDGLAFRICQRVFNGEGLREVCRDSEMPTRSMIYRWLQDNESFRDQYTHAREGLLDYWAEDIVEISDDGRNDWMERRSESEKGAGVQNGYVLNGEHVQRSKLRVDSRKWLLSKLAPKKYGDKIETTVEGGDKPVHSVTEIRRTLVDPKPTST